MIINSTYIAGQRGRWLLTEWSPTAPSGKLLVIFPPFAEEANRCRRIFADLALNLSLLGWKVWLPDFFGTGDSDGDFRQIDLNVWIDDLELHLSQTNHRELSFLACRFGALIAARFLEKYPPSNHPRTLILWQPLTSAKNFWKEIFRNLQVSSIVQNKVDKISVQQTFINNGFLDAQGYEISLDFYQQTLSLSLDSLQKVQSRLCWIECSQQLSASASTVKYWQQISGHAEHIDNQTSFHLLKVLPIDFFWLTQNPIQHQSLLEATIVFLNQRQPEVHGK
jgi:exosortase A-associated hydrolase 2